jgi:hypothetical protein
MNSSQLRKSAPSGPAVGPRRGSGVVPPHSTPSGRVRPHPEGIEVSAAPLVVRRGTDVARRPSAGGADLREAASAVRGAGGFLEAPMAMQARVSIGAPPRRPSLPASEEG